MGKQTKHIITREWVEKELRFYNTADLRSSLVLCCVLSLFFLPLTFGFIYGIFLWFETVWLKIFFSVLIGGLISAPVWINLLSLRHILAERKMLLRGEFDITIQTVSYKSEKIVHRHIEKFLHFTGYQDISVANTTFDLASQGNKFYIVHYQTQNIIKLLYPQKTHEYNDK